MRDSKKTVGKNKTTNLNKFQAGFIDHKISKMVTHHWLHKNKDKLIDSLKFFWYFWRHRRSNDCEIGSIIDELKSDVLRTFMSEIISIPLLQDPTGRFKIHLYTMFKLFHKIEIIDQNENNRAFFRTQYKSWQEILQRKCKL